MFPSYCRVLRAGIFFSVLLPCLTSRVQAATAQTIAFGALDNLALSAGLVTVTATAGSGLIVTFTSTTQSVCMTSGDIGVGGNVISLAALGTCSLTASQAGNGTYAAAAPVTRTFTVNQGYVITTVAGGGAGGDGGPAINAALVSPQAVAADSAGNLYVVDGFYLIRKIAASTGLISTVAANGCCTGGDGSSPSGIAVDAAGNIYIADPGNRRIRKVTASTGIVSTVAGTGTNGFSGDGGLATNAKLNNPTGVAVDAAGALYIADSYNNRIRVVSPSTGLISTVAGTGTAGFSGDGGPASIATLSLSFRHRVRFGRDPLYS